MGCLRCFSGVKSFHVKIILLDKQELIQEVQEPTTGQQLLDNIFTYLNLIETSYFGLRYQDNGNQTHWLDMSKRVCRQIHGFSPVTLYLGVKFYAADPCKLVEEITRYQFFLQVKLDILQGRLPVSQELSVDLAALALQSELGDYDPNRHSPGYVSEFRFMAAQSEEMESEVEAAHASMAGLGVIPATAEMTYLEKVKWLDMYGVDLHPVIGEDNIEYFLGLTPSGIIVLRNRSKVGNYFWPRITKIYFKGKYFMLRVRDKNTDENTYGFETPSRQACKHLWKCCVEHHAFFRLIQVSPTFGTTGIFSLGSRFRYSGHTQTESLQQVKSAQRQPPQFTRKPSKRYSRRKCDTTNTENEEPNRREGETMYRSASTSSVTATVGATLPNTNNSSNRLLSDMMVANGSLKRQNHINGRFATSRSHQRSNSGVSNNVKSGSAYTNSLPRHISLYNNNNDNEDSRKENQRYNNSNIEGKENLQDISLNSLQWLESRGLFGGGGGMHHGSNKGLNINSNSGNGSNVVTSASASGNHQVLDGISGLDGLSTAQSSANERFPNRNSSGTELHEKESIGVEKNDTEFQRREFNGDTVDRANGGNHSVNENGDPMLTRKPFVGSTPLSEEMYAIQMMQNNGINLPSNGNQHHHHRRSGRKSAATSDNESEASGMSWASAGVLQGGAHSSHRRRNESGSESESRSSRRADRRGRRKSRQGSYKLIESDEQWKLIQEQRNVSQHRSGHHRSASAHSRKGDATQNQKSTSPTTHSSVGMNMTDGGVGGTRKSGYANSGAETETEMVSVSSMKRTRRRRSRSRSPGESRSSRGHGAQLPEELLRHVEFGLVEPSGDDDVRLRGEIPFTNIETTKNTIPHRPAMSAAAATTRSINRLHTTKSRNNYRPPPPPPSSSTPSFARQNIGVEYTSNMHNSETRSEVMVNTGIQNRSGHVPSATYNHVSSSPNVYNQGKPQQIQHTSRPNENYHNQQYYDQQHPSTTPQFYNSQRLIQNYEERNSQQNLTQSSIYNRQINQIQHGRPISSVSSSPNMMKGISGMNAPSPNMMKGISGMNAPSPIVPSSASPYTNPNHIDYNTAVTGSYQNSVTQQTNSYGQPIPNRVTGAPSPAHSYYPNSSSQNNSRVYTVNQPRPSPRNIQHQYPSTNPPVNSSTPIRQQGPQNVPQLIANNGYHGGMNRIPIPQQQSDVQGPSNVVMGNAYQKSNPVGHQVQFNRAPPSYQSPYSATVSNTLQQQHYPMSRGSSEQLDAKVNQNSPQNLPISNISVPNGNTQLNMTGKASHHQNTNNMYYHDNSGTGRSTTNGHEHGQPINKGGYALPPTVLTQGTGHSQANRNETNVGNHHRFSPVKNYAKPAGDEMSTEL